MAMSGKIHFDRAKFDAEVSKELIKLGNQAAKDVKKIARAKVHKRTGRLRRSIEIMSPRKGPRFYSISVGSKVKYARAHHEGTEPYIITPKPGHKVMRFKGGKGIATDANGYVYARRVRHPRIKPNRYLTDAAKVVAAKWTIK